MRVYRVFNYDPNAAPTAPGGVLYIPPQGAQRADNPRAYQALYAGDSPAGVCAEAFNRGKYREAWSAQMLRGIPLMPESRRALAWFDLREEARPICDLDDPHELLTQNLRPSLVITRDYAISQAWALRIFEMQVWSGVRWWSYHDARWASMALWDREIVEAFGVEELTLEHPGIVEAARVLQIRVQGSR